MVTTIDTKYEYDESGKVIHKTIKETKEFVSDEHNCKCCCDEAEVVTEELEVPVSFLDIIAGAAGVASIIASCCAIVKLLRSK